MFFLGVLLGLAIAWPYFSDESQSTRSSPGRPGDPANLKRVDAAVAALRRKKV